MSKLNTFSANHFTHQAQLAWDCTENPGLSFGFNPADYSRFKYGSKSIARRFGRELADKFVESDTFKNMFEALSNPRGVLIYPAPYNFIPTATFALKDYFIARYNEIVIPRFGFTPLQEGKISRQHSYQDDYGAMDKEARSKAISGDDFYIDVTQAQGKTLIYVDDIRITGAHEDRIRHMAESNGLAAQPHVYMYYAQLVDPEQADPTIENYLNYYSVKNLLDIDRIIKNDSYQHNTRVTKYILNAPVDEFQNFIRYQSRTFRHTLLHNAYGNSYHKIEGYQQNFKFLTETVEFDDRENYEYRGN